MGTLVRALEAGFANGRRVRKGAQFELADGVKPGHWLEVVKETAPVSKAELKAKGKGDVSKKAADKAAKEADDAARLRGLAPAKAEVKPDPESFA